MVVIVVILASCNPHKESAFLQIADSLLWSNPDSCIVYIAEHLDDTSAKESTRAELIYQHAYFKVTGELENDSILMAMAENSLTRKQLRISGEANYILGAYYVQNGEFFEATLRLKQAERLLSRAAEVPIAMKGMLYFNLGIAAEQSRLYEIAREYGEEAIPYLNQAANPIYLSVCYHMIGKCNTSKDSCLMYLDSALFYAQQAQNTIYYKEAEITRYQIQNEHIGDDKIVRNMMYLCDSCNLYSYAGQIATILLEHNQYDRASYYLGKLAPDTSVNIWSREQYQVLKAELLHAQGCEGEAFNIYKELHQQQTTEIQSSAYASTYIISQKYDAAREQELRLQETIKKQRAYIWIAFCMLLCILIGGYTYYKYKKGQYELKLGEEEKKRMAQELEAHKAILRTRISERLQVARKIHSWGSHHEEKIPEELNILAPSQAARDVQNWKRFYDEFNLCFDNLLLKLQEKHPNLTDSDLQYIALTFLGFDITDLCFLLGITNRTIWNRRSIVKQHLNLPEGKNQDEWIVKEMPQEFGLAVAEDGDKRRKRQDKDRRKKDRKKN